MGNPFVSGNSEHGLASNNHVLNMCENFISGDCPDGNVILENEFDQYRPLFVKRLAEQMNKEDLEKLADKFYHEVSIQHPVYIISHELDQNGRHWFGDNKKHKVIYVLPPVKRECKSLNSLDGYAYNIEGKEIPIMSLINLFVNATLNKNPGDYRDEMYAHFIMSAIKAANPRSGEDREEYQFAKLAHGVLNNNPSKSNGTKQQQPKSPARSPTRSAPAAPAKQADSMVEIVW